MAIACILKNMDANLDKICKDTENKLYKIISNEFIDFDNIYVKCPQGNYSEVELHKDNNWIRFYLSPYKWNNRSYFRRSYLSGDFTKKEIKEIMERLNKLCE